MTEKDLTECDLIMKGGVTSGVVYPKAVSVLSEDYRFRDIGGTSAGAIAAVFAAAAEFRRQASGGGDTTGFDMIEGLAGDLGNLEAFFQPEPKLRSLFEMFKIMINNKTMMSRITGGIWGLIRHYWWVTVAGALVTLFWIWSTTIVGLTFTPLFIALVGAFVTLLGCAVWAGYEFFFRLPRHDFGLCSGRTISEAYKTPGLIDWVAEKVDDIAGVKGRPKPLTVGDLAKYRIRIGAMTTDLSSGRPYQLPLKDQLHCFSRAEFDALFPSRVVDHLVAAGQGRQAGSGHSDEPEDLHRLMGDGTFPVVLVARMSLSFPGLIRAVPLYRIDYKHLDSAQHNNRRCLFSDGGISSNFPVHMFDGMLPSRPTFGIALTSYNENYHTRRVELLSNQLQSTHVPVRMVPGVWDFIFSIIHTAKDWQDTLTMMLPGFAERVVEIRLDDEEEGGLNLTMTPKTIQDLIDLGEDAGKEFRKFKADDHYRKRSAVLLPKMEIELEALRTAFNSTPEGASMPYTQIIQTCNNHSSAFMKTSVLGFAQVLADAPAGSGSQRQPVNSEKWPVADARVGLVGSADRVPR